MKQASKSDTIGMQFKAEVVSAAPSSERRLAMYKVGLDYHLKRSVFAVLDENGKEVMIRSVSGPIDKLLDELRQVKRPFEICFEASTTYGHLHDLLAKMARRVVVAHPGKLRLIFQAKRKNDRIDARKLAKLLYLGEVPQAYVPKPDVRAWRAMIEHRHTLIAERTRIKNRLRALLRTNGIAAPRGLWTKRGLAWLTEVTFDQPFHTIMRDIEMERLASLNKMLKRVERELNRVGNHHAGVFLLRSIPGVGIRTGEAVAAYIDDARRFGKNKNIGSYFGLVPCEDSSAGRIRLGHITRQGPGVVRKLVTEASWQAIRRSPRVRAYYERVRRDDANRKKIAIIAVAHYLLRAMHAMLCTGQTWDEQAA